MWTMENFLVLFVVGGAAGFLASRVIQGTGLGLLGDIVVGILGAFIGGFVLALLWPGAVGFTGFNWGSLLVAFVGAAILLLLVRVFSARRGVRAGVRR